MESLAAFTGWLCSKKDDRIGTLSRENEEVKRMKRTKWPYFALISLALSVSGLSCKIAVQSGYPISPVLLTEVKLADEFWAPRIETNRTVTIPFAFKQCEATGRVANFEIAGGLKEGAFCTKYPFDDSDVFKIIEGASYALMTHPDPELEKYINELISKIAAAQEQDGYLYTARTIDPEHLPVDWSGKERWANLYMSHELYNVGHLYEAAVAHYRATGKKNLLNVALKHADLVSSVFGPGKRHGAPGHQEIEIGLMKLYRLTGKKRYLELAKFFLGERGNAKDRKLYGEYSQDHKPVSEQTEAVGHAVRATYMYSGMADVAALTGNSAYLEALNRLWENVVSKKMYITGGIGAAGGIEGFGPDYELPNASAYCETCASIGFILWSHRMFLLTGDSKYADILERTLYNAFLSGIGLSGDLFFYPNPLASFGQHRRSPWFNCACCPSNITRFIPQIPGFIYATRDEALYVNLFAAGSASLNLRGQKILVEQETHYPWEGDVQITIAPERPAEFGLLIRVPGWALGHPVPNDLYRCLDEGKGRVSLRVNGQEIPLELSQGYAVIRRVWKAGDVVALEFPMLIRRVVAHQSVRNDEGRVALERGPLVYCAEWPDNSGLVSNLVLPDGAQLEAEKRDEVLNSIVVIRGEVIALREGRLAGSVDKRNQEFMAIPYYAWARRGEGEMAVWLAREDSKARVLPSPTIASRSAVSASGGKPAFAVNDQREPASSSDQECPYLHWWPDKGALEWVQYDFARPAQVSAVEVYWYDDTGRGECRVPASWQVLYKSGEEWRRVQNLEPYGLEKDTYNVIRFRPVRTQALRLEIQLQPGFSAGIHEWKVK